MVSDKSLKEFGNNLLSLKKLNKLELNLWLLLNFMNYNLIS